MRYNLSINGQKVFTAVRLWVLYPALLFVCHISFGQVPVVKEVTPNYGYSGQTISIKGLNFNSTSKVFFGAVQGTIVSQSGQLIEVEVPAAATYERVSVTNANGLTGYSPLPFLLSYGGEPGVSAGDFAIQYDRDAEVGLYDIAIADLDGDGLNDVIGANSKSNYATLLHNIGAVGNLNFDRKQLNLGGVTLNVSSGDLNGDGKPDIVFSEGNNGIRIFILKNNSTGPGDIQFSSQQIAVSGNSTKRIIINDLDLDGKPELIVSDQVSNQISILKNTSSAGSLTFDSNLINLTVSGAGTTDGLVVADMNADGKPDIAAGQFLTQSNGVFITENISTPGNIQFNAFHNKFFPGALVSLKIADLNNDGLPDLSATRILNSDLMALTNASTVGGPITFDDPVSLGTEQRPWGQDYGDMDGDGKADLLVATLGSSLSVNVLLNEGGLSFQKIPVPVDYINRNIKSGDMDGDGKPDIIFTSVDDDNNGIPASKISILRNKKCIIPVIAEEGPVTICLGHSKKLTTQRVTGGTYEWKNDGVVVYNGPDPFFEATQAGDYTVTLIHEGGTCNNVSEAITVEVATSGSGGVGSPTITANDPVCINGTLILTSDDVSADKYEWRGPDGFSATGMSVNVGDFQFSNSGRYYLDVYSGDCIVETQSVVVEAINAPDFNISSSAAGRQCQGNQVTLTVTPNKTDYDYQWYDANGPISGETSHVITVNQAGNYYAEVTDNVNTTCPAIETLSKEVRYIVPPEAQYSAPATVCIGQSIKFINTSSVDDDAAVSFRWEFDDGTHSVAENASHTYHTEGSYKIKLSVSYTGLSCKDEITKTITVQPGLDIELAADNEIICTGQQAELSLGQSYSNYTWSTGETTPIIAVTEGGDYSVTVSNANGCEGSADIAIQAFPLPEVTTTADKLSVAPGEEVQLQATGLSVYQWTPEALLNDPSLPNPVAVLSENTLFNVTGTDENGCPGSASIERFLQTDRIANIIEPKNFFSPNDGDNINSVWLVEKIEQFPQCSVTIMDQSGNKLYEAKPYLNDWDGTVGGRQLPSGVYYYIIRCEGEKITKSGSITLLR